METTKDKKISQDNRGVIQRLEANAGQIGDDLTVVVGNGTSEELSDAIDFNKEEVHQDGLVQVGILGDTNEKVFDIIFYNEKTIGGTTEYKFLCKFSIDYDDESCWSDLMVQGLGIGTGNVKAKIVTPANVAADRTVVLQFLRI